MPIQYRLYIVAFLRMPSMFIEFDNINLKDCSE